MGRTAGGGRFWDGADRALTTPARGLTAPTRDGRAGAEVATVIRPRPFYRGVTQWVEQSGGGRDRGPSALVRAWVEVLVRPRRFFTTGVAPGDQAPGLVFAAGVVLIEEGSRLALVPGSTPVIDGRRVASGLLILALAVVLVAPLCLHLVAAIQTLLLRALVPNRAGISETVQVIAYASAPCVFAGIPIPAVRVLCGLYGTALLVVGLAVVHGTSLPRATLAGAVPAGLVFGYGFRGFAAATTLLTEVSSLAAVGV